LQEKLQSRGVTDIRYELINETGPDHNKTFCVQLKVNGVPETQGIGKSKKQAEQQAAEAMLEKEN
jgi:ribonuclease-3